MRNLIKRNLSGKKTLFLFVLTNIVYALMMLITIPLVLDFAGGMKLLDMMPMGYSVEYVNSLLIALGETGRDAYLFKQIPLDMVYPFLFGISYCLIFAYFLNKLKKIDSLLFIFCLVPIFAGLFDYFENLGIIRLLTTYPNHLTIVAQITNVFSVMKSSLTAIYFISLIIVLVVLGINKVIVKK